MLSRKPTFLIGNFEKMKFFNTSWNIKNSIGFSNRKLLDKHNLDIHKADKNDSKKLPSCDLCDFKCATKKTLKAKKELNDHISQKHQNGKLKCCPHCDFKRATLDKIRYHIDKKHPHHGEKKYFCDICQVNNSSQMNLKQHLAGKKHLKMKAIL